jgi:hypothetical protein
MRGPKLCCADRSEGRRSLVKRYLICSELVEALAAPRARLDVLG